MQVDNFPNYKVEVDGSVINVITNRVLKQHLNKQNSCIVTLVNGIDKKNIAVHRLVAELYIPNPDNLRFVCHIDGDPTNNHKDNLIWCKSNNKAGVISGGKSKEYKKVKQLINQLKKIEDKVRSDMCKIEHSWSMYGGIQSMYLSKLLCWYQDKLTPYKLGQMYKDIKINEEDLQSDIVKLMHVKYLMSYYEMYCDKDPKYFQMCFKNYLNNVYDDKFVKEFIKNDYFHNDNILNNKLYT